MATAAIMKNVYEYADNYDGDDNSDDAEGGDADNQMIASVLMGGH